MITEVKEFRDWSNCPYLEGDFETGCHTHQGNGVVLYVNTTKRLFDFKESIFAAAWKHFIRKNSSMTYDPLFDKEGLPKNYRYNILNKGIYVPTLISSYTLPATKRLYNLALERYKIEMKEEMEVDVETFKDFHNWLMRDFNTWLNEHKVQK